MACPGREVSSAKVPSQPTRVLPMGYGADSAKADFLGLGATRHGTILAYLCRKCTPVRSYVGQKDRPGLFGLTGMLPSR
jgi:hypothetical protein